MRRATSCTSIGRPKRLYFYPRSPCGERRVDNVSYQYLSSFLSTLSLRRATFANVKNVWDHVFLSTLSLRRATSGSSSCARVESNFYPRSPCGERLAGPSGPAFLYYFYPRSPCGERRHWSGVPLVGRSISIHALLAESDAETAHERADSLPFLSTLSLRRATRGWTLNINGAIFLSTLSLRRATHR